MDRVGKALETTVDVIGAIFGAILTGVGKLIGGLIAIAFLILLAVGSIGLLWFSVKQLVN
jgi:hypothetical protein